MFDGREGRLVAFCALIFEPALGLMPGVLIYGYGVKSCDNSLIYFKYAFTISISSSAAAA